MFSRRANNLVEPAEPPTPRNSTRTKPIGGFRLSRRRVGVRALLSKEVVLVSRCLTVNTDSELVSPSNAYKTSGEASRELITAEVQRYEVG